MCYLLALFRSQGPGQGQGWQLAGSLLLMLLGPPAASRAQPTAPQSAAYQRRLRAQRFDYRYWDARHDSLRRVLAGQRADTLRLQTLQHLFNLIDLSQDALPTLLREHREALALATKRHYPEQVPLRLVVAYDEMALAPAPNRPALRDTLLAALRAFEALGDGPQPFLLESIRDINIELKQPEANRSFFTRRLAYYRARGAVANTALCYRALGNYYWSRGDYNQGISMRLRAAELFRTFTAGRYYNEIGVIGTCYAEWGSPARALPYLRQAVAWPGTTPANWGYLNRNIALIYLRQRRYPLALRYTTRALHPRPPAGPPVAAYERALGLVQLSEVLLALGNAAAVPPLLGRAQRLVDSLHIPVYSHGGNCELHATWARYYAATGDARRAEAAWLAAYRQARQEHWTPLRLAYLHALAGFYQQRGQPARAAPYALAALGLADTLDATQAASHVARYELEQTERAQQRRLARLRHIQEQAVARARQQRAALAGLMAGLAGLGGLAVLLWRTTRRQRRDNALLATQRRQLEALARRLGELDAAKNQFFANASHELRTPLTLVLAPLETLLDNSARLPAAVRGPVALAHRQARRLNELVNRILDLTRLQAGRLPVQPTPTTVAPFLRRVVAEFAPLAAARGLALHGAEPLPDGLCLLVDADKVEQILTNLLSNALNHTPVGGTVALTAALPGPDGYYALTVRDTGPGIAAAEQARVFERFYQSPQNQALGGTGLGLALSRELAELLGGTLTLASGPGPGAAFTLRFPAEVLEALNVNREGVKGERGQARVEEPEARPLPDPAPEALNPGRIPVNSSLLTFNHRPRVLLVEDQPDLRAYLRELLSPAYEVLTAADGQAALELLTREAPVDLIATDAMMPRLSGTELLAQLKADPARAGIPVLMLTARADEAHHRAALTVGVDDYLTKPFAPAELLARVRTLLARQQVRRHFATLPDGAPDAPATAPVPAPAALEAAKAVAEAPLRPEVSTKLAQWQARVAGHLADEHFGPPELARLLGLSERTLYRRLGELAGLTPAAWLRELRLHQARQLLEAGGFGSVSEVADAVGFASAKYFSTCYAERFGRRPGDHRSAQE